MTSGSMANNSFIYGTHTHSFVLQHLQVIEIILNNQDTGKHPFHLRAPSPSLPPISLLSVISISSTLTHTSRSNADGHNFQLIHRAPDDSGDFDPSSNVTFTSVPMRRDTVLVRPSSNLVLRFRADNPGVWLFHCHIEWHLESGLIATMVEAPLQLPSLSASIPADHLAACAAAGVATSGNAAGNTIDLLDLKGEPKPPAPLPDGFTGRGIAALVCSILSAFLGMAIIGWYGVAEIPGTGIGATGGGILEVVAEK